MPRYPRKAYCLDRGPPPKDNALRQIFGDKQEAIDNLLTESNEENQDKTLTITEILDSTPDILRCSRCDFTSCDYIKWKNHRKTCHPLGKMIEKRFETTVDNSENLQNW